MSDYDTQLSEQAVLNRGFDPSTNAIRVNSVASSSSSSPSTIGDGRKTVTTAGTAEAIAGSTTCRSVAITALIGNTGVVVVGGSSVVAAASTRRGIPLNAGDTITIDVSNLSAVYLDVTVSGEGVSYTYAV